MGIALLLNFSTIASARLVYGGLGVQPGVGFGAPGVQDLGYPGVGIQPGVGVGAPGVQDLGYPGVGIQPGVGVGVPGPGLFYSYPPPAAYVPPPPAVPTPALPAELSGEKIIYYGNYAMIMNASGQVVGYAYVNPDGQWVIVRYPTQEATNY